MKRPAPKETKTVLELRRDDLARLISSIIADGLDELRPGRLHDTLAISCVRLDCAPIGASPAELNELARRVLFTLHLGGLLTVADLLASPWVDRWAIMARAATSAPKHTPAMSFLAPATGVLPPSSGPNGQSAEFSGAFPSFPSLPPQPATHPLEVLTRRAEVIGDVLQSRFQVSRAVCLVPPQSASSVIATILLPQLLDVPAVDERVASPGQLVADLRAGDLVIARGDQAIGLLHMASELPAVALLLIDAPVTPEVWLNLKRIGIQDTIELHGTHEAGPIGWRDGCDQPFALLADWVRGSGCAALRHSDGERFDLPLGCRWLDQRRYQTDGLSSPISSGGPLTLTASPSNLAPSNTQHPESTSAHPDPQRGLADRCARVAETLRHHPLVLDVAIRPARTDDRPHGLPRLQAYIIPRKDHHQAADLLIVLERFAAMALDEFDRPIIWTIGPDMHGPGLAA